MKHLIAFLSFLFALPSCACFAQSIPASGTNLPIIILKTTYGLPVPAEGQPKSGGTMKIISHDDPGRLNMLTDTAFDYDGAIEIGVRGESSAGYLQHPYSIGTLTSSGSNNNVSVLGMPADNDWVLISLYNDKSLIRNMLAYKMSAEMGYYTSRSRLCEVILNDNYVGIYVFGEKIKQGDNRVDIAKLKTTDTAGDNLTGGYIFKVDILTDSTVGWKSKYHPIDHRSFDVYFLYDYPKSTAIEPTQKVYLQAYVDSFETALYSDHFADTANGYRKFMEPVSFVDYGIVNEVARNPDGFRKSYYFYKDKDSKDPRIKNGPVWDFDWAWKNILETPIFDDTDGGGWAYLVNNDNPEDVNSPDWMVRLMQDCAFQQSFHDRYKKFRGSSLNLAHLNSYIDSMAAILTIDSAAGRHFARWQTLGVAGPTLEVGFLPTTFEGEISRLKNWIAARINWLDANIPQCDTAPPPAPVQTTLAIYPDPIQDYLMISFPTSKGPQVGIVMLRDMFGKVVFTQTIDCTGKQRIPLSGLVPGCYVLQLTAPAVSGNTAIDLRRKVAVSY